jgi:predicted transcriptional regulator
MVAPNYAKQRSELAKSLGLGQFGRKRAQHATPDKEAPKRGRGPPKKGTEG